MTLLYNKIMNTLLADTNARPIEIVDGHGCCLIDAQGKQYLDFLGGWCVGTVGWKHPKIIAAITTAIQTTPYIPQVLRDPTQNRLAELLLAKASGQLSRVWRCTSGSEAVEFAIKGARAATGKSTIISIDNVYHGYTYGASAVGDAYKRLNGPMLPGFIKLPMPNAYHGVTAADVLTEFEQLLNMRDDIAAFLSEPVWSNGGVVIPPPDFYPRIQELCRQHGVLFIMDEVATGCGRCGRWLASELWNLSPDILCLAKGLSGGYGSIGATLITEAVYEKSKTIPSYSTFGWLMTDRAAAQANVELIMHDTLWDNAAEVGKYIVEQLQPLLQNPHVGDIRGVGLLIGIEIVKDHTSRERDNKRASIIVDQCAESGLLLETADNVLFLSPPLVLTKAEAKRGTDILQRVLKASH